MGGRQLERARRIDEPRVEGEGGGAQARRRVGPDGRLLERRPELVERHAGTPQVEERRHPRLLGRLLVHHQLPHGARDLGGGAGRDLIEQPEAGPAGERVGAAHDRAGGGRGGGGRAGGQLEHRLLRQPPEASVLVGQRDRQHARRLVGGQRGRFAQDRDLHLERAVAERAPQRGAVRALAEAPIDRGGDLDPTAPDLGRRIAERRRQDLVLAGAPAADEGQRVQRLPAGEGIGEGLLERGDAARIAEQHQRHPARHRPQAVEGAAHPGRQGRLVIALERAIDLARADPRGHLGRQPRGREAGVGDERVTRAAGQEREEGEMGRPGRTTMARSPARAPARARSCTKCAG